MPKVDISGAIKAPPTVTGVSPATGEAFSMVDPSYKPPSLFDVPKQLSGGYDKYNAMDDNWLLMANTGSGNYLFKIDNDTVQQPNPLPTRSHIITVTTFDDAEDNKKFLSNKNLYTLCKTHHLKLHTLYGQNYSNH